MGHLNLGCVSVALLVCVGVGTPVQTINLEKPYPKANPFLPDKWAQAGAESRMVELRKSYTVQSTKSFGTFSDRFGASYFAARKEYEKTPTDENLFRLLYARWLAERLDASFVAKVHHDAEWPMGFESHIRRMLTISSPEWARATLYGAIGYSNLYEQPIVALYPFLKKRFPADKDLVIQYSRFVSRGLQSESHVVAARKQLPAIYREYGRNYTTVGCELGVEIASTVNHQKDKVLHSKIVALCKELEKLAPAELLPRAKKRTGFWASVLANLKKPS
ncbi:MAG: hypothetical protein ABL962_15240 [Fimbriimonadaceae bacterium]